MKINTLSPADATWLAETFARNAGRFAGWSMMAEEPKPDPTDLGEGGKKALADERAARKKAEDEVKALRGEGGRTELQTERAALEALESEMAALKDSLAEAFGVKPDPNKDADVLASVQASLAEIKRESAVLRLANEHQITDKDDLALLGATHDPEAQVKLAARLAAKKDEGPGTPKPDLSQGPKGDPAKPESLPGVPRMAAAFDDAMTANTN